MYTITVTNPANDMTQVFEAQTSDETARMRYQFEMMGLDVVVQDDSDLNKEGCYDGGFYDEPITHMNQALD